MIHLFYFFILFGAALQLQTNLLHQHWLQEVSTARLSSHFTQAIVSEVHFTSFHSFVIMDTWHILPICSHGANTIFHYHAKF